MLRAIWGVSLILFAVSMVATVALLMLRLWRRRREHGEKTARARLSALIVVWLHEPGTDITALKEAAHHAPRQVGGLLTHALGLLQGEDQLRLVQLGRKLGLEAFLLRELADGWLARRVESAEKLAFFSTNEVADALTSTLDDRRPSLRLAAARSLAVQGRDVPVHVLRDPRLGDSILIEDLFEKLAARQSKDLVALACDPDVALRTRASAVRALAGTGDYALLAVFSALAEGPLPELRAAAAIGLGRLGHPKAQHVLARLFDDGEYLVRAAAAQAVGTIHLSGLYESMARLLDDEQWWVRLAAAEGLAKGGEQGRRVLRMAHEAGTANARDMAEIVLLEHGEANA